jgi:hypothetical protein
MFCSAEYHSAIINIESHHSTRRIVLKCAHFPIRAITKTIITVTNFFKTPIDNSCDVIIFGSIPGLDSQTRLMTGFYFGKFWVTPKYQKKQI